MTRSSRRSVSTFFLLLTWFLMPASARPSSNYLEVNSTAHPVSSRLRTGQIHLLTSSSGDAGATAGTMQLGSAARVGDTPLVGDVDGDGKSDLITWHQGTDEFHWLTSSSGYDDDAAGSKQWDSAGGVPDVPLTGDIDGDGKTDLIVWRAGTFYWFTSSSGWGSKQWGSVGGVPDVPLLGDIDGDGKADLIFWRPGTGEFHWLTSSSGYNYGAAGSKQWGSVGGVPDVPLMGDIDGDGKADLIVWRPGTGEFHWLSSSSGYKYGAAGSKQWGSVGGVPDVPLIGDIDGDGKADLMVWRPGTGRFYWWLISSSGSGSKQWGSVDGVPDVPLVGEIDGDGKADLIFWRPGTGEFQWLTSSSGYNYAAAGGYYPPQVNQPPTISAGLTIEAENASIKTAGGPIAGGWNLWSNGEVGEYVSILQAGTYSVVIRAYGSPLGGIWPLMALTIDGLSGQPVTVGSGMFQDYSFQVDLTPGVHSIGAGFLNDALSGTEDRNLFLDKIVITTANQPPVTSAGSNQTITLPASATLTGTATDDGLPAGSTLARTWSKVSGPGSVAFGTVNASSTTASFSAAGTYVLRLTATDSALTATADVTITVKAATSTALWSAGIETGDLREWGPPGGGQFNSGDGMSVASQDHAHSGQWSAKMTITNVATASSGTRLFRWNEQTGNNDLYYSAWYYVPQVYTKQPYGWMNWWSYKSATPDGKNDPFFSFDVSKRASGNMYFELNWWPDLQIEGPGPGQMGGRIWASPVDIPVGRWFHVETRYVCAGDFTGAIQVWQDGVQIFNLTGVKTRYVYGNCQWMVSSYGYKVTPTPVVIYVDDLAISKTRIGP